MRTPRRRPSLHRKAEQTQLANSNDWYEAATGKRRPAFLSDDLPLFESGT